MLTAQRGQTVVEYVGVLAIIAAIVAALATSPIFGELPRRISRGICNVTGGQCDAASAGPRTAARDADPGAAASTPRRLRAAAAGGVEGAVARGASIGDILDDVLNFLDGPVVTEIDGYLVPVLQAGVKLPTGLIRKLFKIGPAVAERAKRYAKRLGISVEVLLSSQRFAAMRVTELQKALPAATRGRVTMAVAIGKDSAGRLRIVVGTSEKGGALRAPVAAKVKDSGAAVAKGYDGHAEIQIISYMRDHGLKLVTMGAGRPICAKCAAAVREAGGTFATGVKQTSAKP